MTASKSAKPATSRLSRAQRREQLLETALRIIREEGADRLTLGRLAEQAGVSKPIAYDHFGTRAGLLVALYKMLDERQVAVLREALARGPQTLDDAAALIARTYIHCGVDSGEEWHAVGAALAGSEEMGAVQRELLDGYVQLFAGVLRPYATLDDKELKRRCIGLVGAGEALSVAMLAGRCSEADAASALAAIIEGGVS